MKKIILFICSLVSVFYVLNPKLVLAAPSSLRQDTFDQLGAAAGTNGANLGQANDPRTIAARIIRIGLGIIGTVFLVLTIYAGFLWMTAGGEEEKAGKARKLLYDGVIGLAIILAAYSITYFISNSLLKGTTGNNSSEENVPDYCLQESSFTDPRCQG
jgi:hypothetical protein